MIILINSLSLSLSLSIYIYRERDERESEERERRERERGDEREDTYIYTKHGEDTNMIKYRERERVS